MHDIPLDNVIYGDTVTNQFASTYAWTHMIMPRYIPHYISTLLYAIISEKIAV